MSRLRVLIVDDDKHVCDFLIEMLTPDEVDAVAFNDPRKALEHLVLGTAYHLVILDLKMPGLTGLALLEQIRKLDQNLAVIILTAFPSLESATDAINLDVSAYMQKPFSGEEIRETIARVTRMKGIMVRAEDALHIAVGKRIRELRKRRGFALKQMSRRTSLSVTLLSQIERAESSPSLSVLHKIARALDLDIRLLFDELEAEPPAG